MELKLNRWDVYKFNRSRPKAARKHVCNAPFSNLYFGMKGEMGVCCANRDHIIGHYPQNSIKEAWEGEKMKEMRSAITKRDMSLGCYDCYNLIKGGNYNNVPLTSYDRPTAFEGNFPRKMEFELANTCNLECIMCRGELSSSIRRNREKLPPIQTVYDANFIQQLEAFIPHLEYSYFAGGEPFLIGTYLEIWEKMMALNPKMEIAVQTNATIMSDRIRRIMDAMRFDIAVSIDSVDPDNYAYIRKNGQWDKVERNIHHFRDYCLGKGTELTISYTPMVPNWQELPEVIRFCNRLNARVFFNNLTFPKPLAFDSLPAMELKHIASYLQEALPDLERTTSVKEDNFQRYQDLLNQITYWAEIAEHPEKNAIPRKAKDFPSYMKQLEGYLEEEGGSFELVSEKLNHLLGVVDTYGKYDELVEHLLTIDFKVLAKHVAAKSQEELLIDIRTSVLSLE